MWYDFILVYKDGTRSKEKWGTAPNIDALKRHVKREYKTAETLIITSSQRGAKGRYKIR